MLDVLKLSFEFSPKLGVRELPQLDRHHQSTVPGLYVVGDLADAPIIKVALNQGYDVAQHVADQLGAASVDPELLDVVIVGAGPAGIGAALALQERGLSCVILEKERPLNTIQNFPKAKWIFTEPYHLQSRGGVELQDASKEDLVARWEQAIEAASLPIRQPQEVVDVQRVGQGFEVRSTADEIAHTTRCRRVILAIGRRAAVNRLGCEGEELPKVSYVLRDADDHRGRRVLIVGGGDSAVEAALACAAAGAEVTLSYRGEVFRRAKAKNQQALAELERAGGVRVERGTQLQRVTQDSVRLSRGGEPLQLDNDDVMIFIGTHLPRSFLRRLGVRMAGQMDAGRALWIASFALLTYLFYVLKGGTVLDASRGLWVAKKPFFPFGPDHLLGFVPDLLHFDLGFRAIDGAFWGTLCYSVVILVFGLRARARYADPVQKRRYLSLIAFQWVFLFGVPELIAPLVIRGSPTVAAIFGGDRAWRMYGLSVPWPLNIWSLIDAPSWAQPASVAVASGWIALGAITSFVLLPLYIRTNNEKFCSYLCGCGGLAETLGDFWRHLAPRGRTAKQAEGFGRLILLLAIPVTLLILNDAWQFVASGALASTKAFAEQWYGLVVDFGLASVLGVAAYPYLGNRVWCRFFCPLRAYMELLSARIGRLAIRSNDKCIGCGECTRFCQMGIDVQSFAQQRQAFDNANSACIQCGICVTVCPMDVLSLADKG